MTGNLAVRSQGLGKKYFIGGAQNETRLREVLKRNFKRMMGRGSKGAESGEAADFWALRNVDFEIRHGEVVGILGRNGAGKSTLLKILSRITEPTEGRAQVHGRVASLLEVGTGFHPELTGRENVFLNGAILGMGREEIRRKFDEIVAFAEIERFLDTPVKRYSSGMYMRLAFAVAAHLDPEILIVDEVLAVGDVDFQRKCLGKMQGVSNEGRTVLFVTHNMAVVERLCSRALLFDQGRLCMDGTARQVLSTYLAMSDAEILACTPNSDSSRVAEVRRIALCDFTGSPLREVTTADTLSLKIDLLVREPRPDLQIAFTLHDELQIPIFSSTPADHGMKQPIEAGQHELIVTFPGPILMPRHYSITVSVYNDLGRSFHNCPHALSFDVQPATAQVYSAQPNRAGLIQMLCIWKHELHPDERRSLRAQSVTAI
jgi:lipopolysaccharide transport system ATP-binding protein